MSLNFKKYILDGEKFVREVAAELGAPEETDKGGRVLRAVLHALRNRITPQESLQLIAQLPMLVKALYVDGWKISQEAMKLRHAGDFIEAVREAGGQGLYNDFTTDNEVEKAIQAVFRVLKNHVSAGEINDILGILPAEVRAVLG